MIRQTWHAIGPEGQSVLVVMLIGAVFFITACLMALVVEPYRGHLKIVSIFATTGTALCLGACAASFVLTLRSHFG